MEKHASRRSILQKSLVAVVAIIPGCSAIFGSEVDVIISNDSDRTRTITASVNRRDTGETYFETEVELAPDESRRYQNVVPIQDRSTTLVVASVVDGVRSEGAFSVSRGTDVKYFAIDVHDEETTIGMVRG